MYKTLCKHKIITALHKFIKLQDLIEYNNNNPDNLLDANYFAISTGISDNDYENLVNIMDNFYCKWIVIDIANGYIDNLKNFCRKVREKYTQKIIVAGNVCTKEGVNDLLNCGVDIVKVGIGGGCFRGDTRVLMATGIYKNISDIDEGEYVINKNGDAVKVLNKMNKGIKNVINIRTNNWHNNTYVTPDHNYWIGDLSTNSKKSITKLGKAKLLDKMSKTIPRQSKYKWNNIENSVEKKLLLMPKNIIWKLPENFNIDLADYSIRSIIDENYIITKNANDIKTKRHITSNYDLGYIFGTFLGDGNSRITISNKNCESGSCHWSFGINENDIANKLERCIYNTLEYSCSIKKKKDNVLQVNCYNKCFSKLLDEFSKRDTKFLPQKFYCSNKDYIQGLFDGLIDSDGNIEITNKNNYIYNFTNTSKYILELFYWCCMNLNLSFSSKMCHKSIGNLEGTSIDNLKDCYRIKTHTFNRFTKDYVYSEILDYNKEQVPELVWDIEVDCDTHSFIANNSIVHNSACTTRIQTGIGMPQFSCILKSCESKKNNTYIISDGGITCPGDMAKSFGAGADFVMVGGEFSGHDENPGELIEESGVKYKFFYGMSSSYAMKNNYAANNNTNYRSSEGREIKVKYKGKLDNTVENYLGGLRSTCTYTNSSSIELLNENCKFILVNNQYNSNLVNEK